MNHINCSGEKPFQRRKIKKGPTEWCCSSPQRQQCEISALFKPNYLLSRKATPCGDRLHLNVWTYLHKGSKQLSRISCQSMSLAVCKLIRKVGHTSHRTISPEFNVELQWVLIPNPDLPKTLFQLTRITARNDFERKIPAKAA